MHFHYVDVDKELLLAWKKLRRFWQINEVKMRLVNEVSTYKVNEARTGRAHFQRVTLYMQIWSLASVYFGDPGYYCPVELYNILPMTLPSNNSNKQQIFRSLSHGFIFIPLERLALDRMRPKD